MNSKNGFIDIAAVVVIATVIILGGGLLVYINRLITVSPSFPYKSPVACTLDADCTSGLVCHWGACTSPIGPKCSGPGAKCPAGYQCIQSCGPPVARKSDPPPPYYCELDKVAKQSKICPICLASNTEISTPSGPVNVKDIKAGMTVWSLNKKGEMVKSVVIEVSRVAVSSVHRVVHLVLSDKRAVWLSPGHPTVSGISVSELRAEDYYDGAQIVSAESVPYWDTATYDLLPDSDTGYYWANGILFGSTLF